jgi:RimJ/RimL family protein N-acetyltransferase
VARTAPPYRIETKRLVLRCWDPRDAQRLKEAVDSSVEHLRPWMPWAVHEPQPLEQKVGLLQRFRAQFEIRVDPANARSAAIPRKLGFREEATLRRRLPAVAAPGPRDVAIYSLFCDELTGTPVAAEAVQAYDATGARVL